MVQPLEMIAPSMQHTLEAHLKGALHAGPSPLHRLLHPVSDEVTTACPIEIRGAHTATLTLDFPQAIGVHNPADQIPSLEQEHSCAVSPMQLAMARKSMETISLPSPKTLGKLILSPQQSRRIL